MTQQNGQKPTVVDDASQAQADPVPAEPLHRRSIRTQLVISNIIVLTVLMGALGLAIHFGVRATIIASVDHQMDSVTRIMAALPPFGPPPPRLGPGQGPPANAARRPQPPAANAPKPAPLPRDVIRAFRDFNRMRPRRFGLDGRSSDFFGRYDPWDRAAFRASASGKLITKDIVVGGDPFRMMSRPYPLTGAPQGVIQYLYPLGDVYRAMTGVDRVLLTLSPVALVLAGLAGWLLTGRVLGRVRRMTDAAALMGAEDFSRRIPVSGNDEFSKLAETFNSLLTRQEAAIEQQKKLAEMQSRLIDQQRRFTADASHELKTPLTIIKGNAGIALSGNPGPEGLNEALSEIDRAAETMSVLVRDLLLLARSDAGHLGRSPIDILVGEVLSRAVSLARRDGAAPIVLKVEDEGLIVNGNEEELVRVYANVLTNAVQHTPPAGTITATARREGDGVRVAITDTGAGIGPEHLPHLGERFYRADSSRSRADGGTGLGLSICKSIIQAHNGSIQFDSKIGAGTTVTILLPAQPSHVAV